MVNFVIGPACSGKTSFIKATFPDATIVDLWDYQKKYRAFNIETITETYLQTKEALEHALKENPEKQIVLEHTMLKAIRRMPYIETVKNMADVSINCYVMMPDYDTYKFFCKERKIIPSSTEFCLLEIPSQEEGFDNIFIIKPNITKKEK